MRKYINDFIHVSAMVKTLFIDKLWEALQDLLNLKEEPTKKPKKRPQKKRQQKPRRPTPPKQPQKPRPTTKQTKRKVAQMPEPWSKISEYKHVKKERRYW